MNVSLELTKSWAYLNTVIVMINYVKGFTATGF